MIKRLMQLYKIVLAMLAAKLLETHQPNAEELIEELLQATRTENGK